MIQTFLDRNPSGGMHHICYEVEDIIAARDALKANGARVLGDGEPKTGAHGKPVLFLHPKDFAGTLLELEQAGAFLLREEGIHGYRIRYRCLYTALVVDFFHVAALRSAACQDC